MIALLLIAQLGAADIVRAAPPGNFITPRTEIVQALPKPGACMGAVGRLEASLAEPTALYRKGDRPAKGLRKWTDYPQPAFCQIGSGR